MASKGRKKASLFDLSRAPLLEKDQAALHAELLSGTDRSAALVGCAMVDATLVKALTSRFVAMEEKSFEALFYSPTAPLSSFSARIKIARALGVYGAKMNGMLDAIRAIRNVFAHSVLPLTFTHEQVTRECAKLPLAKLKRDLKHELSKERETYTAVCLNMAILFEDYTNRHNGSVIVIDMPDG